jgi:inorganic pyrophosphatase
LNSSMNCSPLDSSITSTQVDVTIEIARWSFLKRGSSGCVDFVSPLPCPFNYGSVRQYIGTDDDFLDAIVLGSRLAYGARVKVFVYGAVGLTDRGMYDDKLVCSTGLLRPRDQRRVLIFMHLYAWAKRVLNLYRRRPGPTRCEGWKSANDAFRRARLCLDETSVHPTVPF